MKKIFTLLLVCFVYNTQCQTLYFNPISYHRYQANQTDVPIQVKPDSQGNIYFLDNTYTIKNRAVVALVKCNLNGDTLWSRYLNETNTVDEYATALAIDGSDNIIVGGNLVQATWSPSNAFSNFVTKFSPSGNVLATDTFSNGKTYNTLRSIAVDGLDNVFVAAESQNNTFDKNILAYKLNSSLQRQWVKTYASTVNKDDEPIKILCDAQNNVYLAARTWTTSTNQNILVLKYDNSGTPLWTLNYDHLGLAKSEYLEGAVLNDTCIYLAAQYNQSGSDVKNFMLKVSQNQTYIKSKQFDAVTYNGFYQTNFISSNNALALSTHYYSDSVAVSLLDTALNVRYTKRFRGNSPPTQSGVQQKCGGLVFNADKKVCASFWLSDTVRVGVTKYAKFFTQIAQIDSLGTVVYSTRLNQHNQIRDSKVVWANNKNYVFGQGSWNTYESVDIYLSTLDDATGNKLNHLVFNCKEKAGSKDVTLKQVPLANGNFILANLHSNTYSFNTIDIIDPALQLQNSVLLRDSVDVNDSIMFIDHDAYDNIYTVVARRYIDSSAVSRAIIRVYKHDANLQQLWVKNIKYANPPYAMPSVALSDSGNIIMSGTFFAASASQTLLKLNSAGAQQWTVTVNTNSLTSVNGKGLVYNKEDVVYLYGAYQVNSPFYQNFSVLKFSANNGALLLSSNYVDSLNTSADIINHALLLNDKLIATGRYANGYQFTASIDTANLQLSWIKFLRYNNTPGVNGGTRLVINQNDIFVIGYYLTVAPYLNRVLFTRYNNFGNYYWTNNYYNPNSDWLVYERYACAAANGVTAVLASSEDSGNNINKNFKLLNYDYSSGSLINMINWTYSTTVAGCASVTLDDIPLNINRNGGLNYLITGYVSTMEWGCNNPNEMFDTFFGTLNPSIVTVAKELPVESNGMTLFPNPGNTELNIKINSDVSNYEINIYNILGEHVTHLTSASNSMKVSTGNFTNGIYFIKVKVGDKELTNKWIKNN